MPNESYKGPEKHNSPENELDRFMPNWIEWKTEELRPDDIVLADSEDHVAVITVAGRDMTIVWSKGTTDQDIDSALEKLREAGYPNSKAIRLGEGGGMRGLKYWNEEKGFIVLRNPMLGINRKFTISDVKINGKDIADEE
jgi:hypothetical protein